LSAASGGLSAAGGGLSAASAATTVLAMTAGTTSSGWPAPGRRRRIAGLAQGLFHLAYPLIVYAAYSRLETRGVALLLLLLYAVSILLARRSAEDLWQLVRPHLGLALVIGVAVALEDRRVLLLLPMFVSLYLLWTFARSLRRGVPMIERIARLVEGELADFKRPYCRMLTAVWCVFLGANALFVAVLAVAAPLEWWTLYTALLFYLLIGALLAAEYVIRKWWFRDYGPGFGDRLLSRLFPAERTSNGRRSLVWAQTRRQGADDVSSPQ
jgi:uncharacterized membrane protein